MSPRADQHCRLSLPRCVAQLYRVTFPIQPSNVEALREASHGRYLRAALRWPREERWRLEEGLADDTPPGRLEVRHRWAVAAARIRTSAQNCDELEGEHGGLLMN